MLTFQVCNIILALKPAWIDFLPTPQERCSGGNIFGLLANKILELTLQSVEESINGFIIKPINKVIRNVFRAITFGGSNGPKLPKVCLTGFWKPGGKCMEGDDAFFDHFGCYNTDRARADQQCYFFRQRAICGMEGGTNRYGRYQDLFAAPTGEALESRYQEIAGDSYRSIPPTLAALISAVDSATLSSDAQAAKNVCDDSIYESMDLDEVRIHCSTAHAQTRPRSSPSACPTADYYRMYFPPHRGFLPVERLVAELPDLCPDH